MDEVIAEEIRQRAAGSPFALATIVSSRGNTPRPRGTSMLLTADGAVRGAVSAGCVDADVRGHAAQVLADGEPALVSYGFTPDESFAVGLSCGGGVDVFIQRVEPATDLVFRAVLDAVQACRPVAHARVVRGPRGMLARSMAIGENARRVGGLGEPHLERRIEAVGRRLLVNGGNDLLSDRHVEVFVQAHRPPRRLLLCGGGDITLALATLGTQLGYRVTVCDPRADVVSAERWPSGVDLVIDWPHRYLDQVGVDGDTVVCSLTHDPKFEIPLLTRALRLPAAYVGALGSRGTNRRRLRALTEAGLSAAELYRLYAPIGLDLGGRRPEETALSIMAEIVAVANGGSGASLNARRGPIHARMARSS